MRLDQIRSVVMVLVAAAVVLAGARAGFAVDQEQMEQASTSDLVR